MVFECRTCLKLCDKVLNVYSNDLPHKIETISSVEILLDYRFPSKICEDCVRNVNQMYEFRKVLQSSNAILTRRCMKVQTAIVTDSTKNNGNLNNKAVERNCEVQQESILDDGEIENIDDDDEIETPETESEKNKIFTVTENSQIEAVKTNFEVPEEDIVKDIEIEKVCNDEIQKPGVASKKTKIFKCSRCDFTSIDKDLWQYHRKRHQNDTMTVCSICGKMYKHCNIRRHYETHIVSPVKCEICERMFKNPTTLRSHMFAHNKRYQCTICGKIYQSRPGYYGHMKRHEAGNAKTLECLTCGKLFFAKDKLKTHLYTHTGEKPYPCKFCEKGFTSRSARRTHEMLHTKENPFSCDFCDAAYPQKVSLQRHLKSKHGDKVNVNKEIAD